MEEFFSIVSEVSTDPKHWHMVSELALAACAMRVGRR